MRIKIIDNFLLFIYTLLYFSLLVTINYNLELANIEKISNLFYDKNALFFSASNKELNFHNIYDVLPDNSVLYSQLPANEDIRGVLYKGHYDAPEIKEGRFFNQNDFKDNARLAVIGNDVSTLKENGIEYYLYNTEKYKVIGVIGYSMPTKLDRTVMLTLNNELLSKDARYIVSGTDTQTNLNFLGNEDLFGQVLLYDNIKPNLLHIVDTGNKHYITSTLFILVIIFNSFLITSFWIEKKRDEFVIKKMNGFNNYQLMIEVVKQVIVKDFISIFTGTALTAILFANRFAFKPWAILLSIIVMLIIQMFYLILLIKKNLDNINEKKLGVNS